MRTRAKSNMPLVTVLRNPAGKPGIPLDKSAHVVRSRHGFLSRRDRTCFLSVE